MNQTEVIINGTLLPDGSLQLNERPALGAGPVEVTIRPVVKLESTTIQNWWDYLRKARADLEAAGHRFRSREEIDAEINAMRDEWD